MPAGRTSPCRGGAFPREKGSHMSRIVYLLLGLLTVGCAVQAPGVPAGPEAPEPVEPSATSQPGVALPPDLGTRTSGSDWPCFLGPTGDSVSTEKGILAPWPKEG